MKNLLLATLAILFISCSASSDKTIKTLIITGQNNHHWQVSHVAIKQTLESSGLFVVDVAVSPEQGQDMSNFLVDFASYQLVVVDYNGDSWSDATKKNFEKYAQDGGGIIIYHAADNAFPDWEEYSKICALGGWEDRDEKSGPYAYVEDGELINDSSVGIGGSHGAQHMYVLNKFTNHPIVDGLPEKWMHTKDELYDRMRGPANIKDLLYTAYADPKEGGSGREEPLIFTVDYGKARIFHTMLGHAGESLENNVAMQCAGFQITLLRGAEWAATGKVTQEIPKNFPNENQVSTWKTKKVNLDIP